MQQFTYLKCNKVGHHEQAIIAVCMDKQCNDGFPCCLICISQLHKNHKNNFVRLDEFNQLVKEENLKWKDLQNQIENLKIDCLKQIKQIGEVFEQFVNCFTKNIQSNISKQLELYKDLPSLEELNILSNHIKSDCQDYTETLKTKTIDAKNAIQNLFSQLTEKTQIEIKKITQSKIKIISILDPSKEVRTIERTTIFQSIIRKQQNEGYFFNFYQQKFN